MTDFSERFDSLFTFREQRDLVYCNLYPGYRCTIEVSCSGEPEENKIIAISAKTGNPIFDFPLDSEFSKHMLSFGEYLFPFYQKISFDCVFTGHFLWSGSTDRYAKSRLKSFKNIKCFIVDFYNESEIKDFQTTSDRNCHLVKCYNDIYPVPFSLFSICEWDSVLLSDVMSNDAINEDIAICCESSPFGFVCIVPDNLRFKNDFIFGDGKIIKANVLSLNQLSDQLKRHRLDSVNSDLDKFEAAPSLETSELFTSDILKYYGFEELESLFKNHSKMYIYHEIIRPFYERLLSRYYSAECMYDDFYFEVQIPDGIEGAGFQIDVQVGLCPIKQTLTFELAREL